MSTLFVLLPDGREPSGSLHSAIRELPGAPQLTIKDAGIATLVSTLEADEVLSILAKADWHFPLLLTYRGADEDRWSYCTITGTARVATE